MAQGQQLEGVLGRQVSAFVKDFSRGAGVHRLDPRRLSGEGFCRERAGPLTLIVSKAGLYRAWNGACALFRRFL
ncbi:unnamed protein product, partial [Pylaiella littoralis]